MKMKKLVVSTLAGLIAFSSASMADAKSDEYIKTFGMLMFQRNGLADPSVIYVGQILYYR